MISFIFISRKSNNGRTFQKQQIGNLIPTIRIPGKQITLLILIADNVGPNFLQEPNQTRASRPTIEPDSKWCFISLISSSNKNIMYFPSINPCRQVSRVYCLIDHALENKRRVTGATIESYWGRLVVVVASRTTSKTSGRAGRWDFCIFMGSMKEDYYDYEYF